MAENAHIRFEELPNMGKKTKTWRVVGRESHVGLGEVRFYPAWRKYVFLPAPETIFDFGCLQTIELFLISETNTWRAGLA